MGGNLTKLIGALISINHLLFLPLGYGEIGLANPSNASVKLTLMWLLINIAVVKNKYGINNLLVHLLLSSCVRPWPAALMK